MNELRTDNYIPAISERLAILFTHCILYSNFMHAHVQRIYLISDCAAAYSYKDVESRTSSLLGKIQNAPPTLITGIMAN